MNDKEKRIIMAKKSKLVNPQDGLKPLRADKILFYVDDRNNAPVYEYIKDLRLKGDKNSHIKYNKIAEYVAVLCELGRGAGEPFMKHIDGEIWELRPTSDRIFFASWINLSCYIIS
jgi:phage-related protein